MRSSSSQDNDSSPGAGAGRERLLLILAGAFTSATPTIRRKISDSAADGPGNFQKTGNFLPAGSIAFDDSDWRSCRSAARLGHRAAFQNDPALSSKGFYPLGRTYPATSVGWYRRVFEFPATDADKRITIEFDGSYRETMVVFNGFYIGMHSGGYDPFSFDVTDFANPGGRNVLLVRVDATSSDGWFYEGAGIYRHVWLVKTHPVHVKKWGTFVRSQVQPGEATLSIRTEVINQGKARRTLRVNSTVLDPTGNAWDRRPQRRRRFRKGRADLRAGDCGEAAGAVVSRREKPLQAGDGGGSGRRDRRSLRDAVSAFARSQFDAEKGFFLNGKPVKLKGTCNHQDHAGIGAALPDAVQYYRISKLQEMGCNSIRTSHNPPTPELLDACDELGMLVFDETRMMSSNPEGLSQFGDLVRRDRNRPSVFMWSMGNEEGQANTELGLLILTAMKRSRRSLMARGRCRSRPPARLEPAASRCAT